MLTTRRGFLRLGGLAAAATAVSGPLSLAQGTLTKEVPKAAPVSPTEDLMREHGVLSRLLLINDALLAPLESGGEFPVPVLAASAGLIRRFIEDYHERLEEDFVFPRFEKAGQMTGLVTVLREQHKAGRRLTDRVLEATRLAQGGAAWDRARLAETLRLFSRMYRPHKAREDTVLFPALHGLLPAPEFERLGEVFEDKEQALFGKNGFEKVVAEVAGLEERLGIHDLARFTPPG